MKTNSAFFFTKQFVKTEPVKMDQHRHATLHTMTMTSWNTTNSDSKLKSKMDQVMMILLCLYLCKI